MLRQHQHEALKFLAGRKSAGIWYEMGLGKTLIALEHLKTIDDNRPTLIVGPLSGVSVWRREAEKFGYDYKFQELVGTYKERISKLNSASDIYVTNYEGMRILYRHLLAKGFGKIIFDESHRIKDKKSQQTKIALELCRFIPYRYLLSGTPITKSPEDIWTQAQAIEQGSLGNFYSFAARYIDYRKIKIRVAGGMREIRKPVKFKNLDELKTRLEAFSIRRTKKECLDLPPKIYKPIYCEMKPEQKAHYYSLKCSLATMLADKQFKVLHAATLMQKLQQVCQGFIYDDQKNTTIFDSGKREVLYDLLKDLEGEKVIIFTWFQADIDILFKDLNKKYKVILYKGDMDERKACEKEFQESTDPCIFLSNVERAKESITLTASSNVVYFGNSWNYATRTQSEDRAHRIGTTKSVVYYDLICGGTIDQLIHDTLQYKGNVADKITGDTQRLAEMIIQQGE